MDAKEILFPDGVVKYDAQSSENTKQPERPRNRNIYEALEIDDNMERKDPLIEHMQSRFKKTQLFMTLTVSPILYNQCFPTLISC
jgi:hypothetical protein